MSKILQSPSVSLETLKKETQGVQTYLNNFRESGLSACQMDAREIAEALDIDMTLPEKRQRKTSRQFLYEGRDQNPLHNPLQKSLSREFFLPLVDTAIGSLNDRFCKLQEFYALYSFFVLKRKHERSNA